MNQILRRDWLPERAKWSYLARSTRPAASRIRKIARKPYKKSVIDQACSVKMARYWPCAFFVFFFCVFMDLDSVSDHKHAKIELGQYPAILTEQAWSITHISSPAPAAILGRTLLTR